MKIIQKYLVFALFTAIGLSCSKDRIMPKESLEVSDGGETRMYTSSIAVSTFQGNDVDEDLRCIVQGTGYDVPTLDFDEDEFKKRKILAHWGVEGLGKHNEGSIDKSVTNSSKQGDVKITYTGNKTKINFSCPVKEDFDVEGKSAWLALGGKLRDGHFLDFTSEQETAPNQKIVGLESGDQEVARQIPVMTEILPFKYVLGGEKNENVEIKFRPRGSILGLCFVNRFKSDVKLKSITLEKDNAFWFEGSFNTHYGKKGANGKPYFWAPVTADDLGDPIFFEGSSGDKELKYPIYDGEDEGFELKKEEEQLSSDLKNRLPLFSIWGFPRTDNGVKDLRLKLTFVKEAKEFTTKVIIIKAPASGFQEQKAYRLPIELSYDLLNEDPEETCTVEFENPLEYVAEFNVNTTADGFATTNDYPYADVGLLNGAEVHSLFKPENTVFKNYHIPNLREMTLIFPQANGNCPVSFYKEQASFKPRYGADDTFAPTIQAGACFKTEDRDERYMTKREVILGVTRYVTYGLRLKGTDLYSAWRYRLEGGETEHQKVVVQAVALKEVIENVEDIAKAEIWDSGSYNGKQILTREFPLPGFLWNYGPGGSLVQPNQGELLGKEAFFLLWDYNKYKVAGGFSFKEYFRSVLTSYLCITQDDDSFRNSLRFYGTNNTTYTFHIYDYYNPCRLFVGGKEEMPPIIMCQQSRGFRPDWSRELAENFRPGPPEQKEQHTFISADNDPSQRYIMEAGTLELNWEHSYNVEIICDPGTTFVETEITQGSSWITEVHNLPEETSRIPNNEIRKYRFRFTISAMPDPNGAERVGTIVFKNKFAPEKKVVITVKQHKYES